MYLITSKVEVMRKSQPSIFLAVKKADARSASLQHQVLSHSLLFEIRLVDLPTGKSVVVRQ